MDEIRLQATWTASAAAPPPVSWFQQLPFLGGHLRARPGGGINRALEARGLRPFSITLGQGSLTILIGPASCPGQSGGCPPETHIDRDIAHIGSRERVPSALGGR